MARFAADVDFEEVGLVGVGREVVVLVVVGRVALGAHRVPVLRQARPVQRIAGFDPFVRRIGRRDVEPLLLVDVPRDAQHLHAAVGELDHVLLQRSDAEGVFDFVVVVLAVGAFGVDHELLAVAEEPRLLVETGELGVVEVAEHRLVGRQFHGAIVVRAFPQVVLGLMAGDAGLAAHVAGMLQRVVGDRAIPIGRRPGGKRRQQQAEADDGGTAENSERPGHRRESGASRREAMTFHLKNGSWLVRRPPTAGSF